MANIFVGVGGTGCGVLYKLAEKIEANGVLSAQNAAVPKAVLWAIDADTIETTPKLDNFFKSELKVENPRKKEDYDLKQGKDDNFREWFDPNYRTSGNINSDASPGAGQIKLNGRYALYDRMQDVMSTLRAISSTPNINLPQSQVHLISSLFGGTGSGIIWDIAYLLQSQLSIDVFLWLLEPSVLKVFDPGKKQTHSWKGAYASLIELDFWMMNNSERMDDRQFRMTYRGNTELTSSSPPGVPVFLFSSSDQDGRSLAQSGKGVMDAYQEFIASAVFEVNYNDVYLKTTKKNHLDNLRLSHSDPTGHSRGFASVGVTYLRFPREKVKYYMVNRLLHRSLLPLSASGVTLHTQELQKVVSTFMSRLEVEEVERHQFEQGIKELPLWKAVEASSSQYRKGIREAKDNTKLPERQVQLDFQKLDQQVAQYTESIVSGGTIESGPYRKSLKGFEPALREKIYELLGPEAGSTLLDVKNFLVALEEEIDKTVAYFQREFSGKVDAFEKSGLASETEKQFKRLRTTKNAFPFGKAFDAARLVYIRKFEEFVDGKSAQSLYNQVTTALSRMKGETASWKMTLEYTLSRVNDTYGDCEQKMREGYKRLREGLFIYDPVLGSEKKNYVFDLSIGDNTEIVDGEILGVVEPPILASAKAIRQELFSGTNTVSGFQSLLGEIHTKDQKDLNDQKVKDDYQNRVRQLLQTVIVTRIEDLVDSIKFQQVCEWQLKALYGYIKGLHERRNERKTEYEAAVGRMRAMFGETGAEALLKGLDVKQNATEWMKRAVSEMVGNIRKIVRPMWRFDQRKIEAKLTPSVHNNTIYPIHWENSVKWTGADGAVPSEDSNSQWYDDRIVFLSTDFGIALSELDAPMLEELKSDYLRERKVKMSDVGRGNPPYHSDYRFYTKWDWDLEKEGSQQSDERLLQAIAIGLVLQEAQGSAAILERVKQKSGYVFSYVPVKPFNGKKRIKLGESLAKSYEKLNEDVNLRLDFNRCLKEAMNFKITNITANKLDNIRLFLTSVQAFWQGLRPPEIKEGKTPKSAGNELSRSYYYWDRGNKWLSSLLSKVTEENYEKLLLS